MKQAIFTSRDDLNNPSELVVELTTYYGGNWAKPHIEIAKIFPQFFKNGNLIKSKFKWLETIEIKQKGYQPKNSKSSQVITKVFVD